MRGNEKTNELRYGTFAHRLGAVIIDAIVLFPWTYMLCFYNLNVWQSFPLFVFGLLLSIGYKVYCEYRYGHTVGKWLFNIDCLNKDLAKLSFWQVITRNLSYIIPVFVRLPFYYEAFTVESLNYTDLILRHGPPLAITYLILSLQTFDLITIFFDGQKRALHDRIAGSVVILRAN